MIAIVDYQVGNTGNVRRAFERLGEEVVMAKKPAELDERISLAVLPGVGAFGPAAERLVKSGWRESLREWAAAGRPLLGICLGMQLLCERGFEDGEHEGLGLIPGQVIPLKASKIPHMGWNTVEWTEKALDRVNARNTIFNPPLMKKLSEQNKRIKLQFGRLPMPSGSYFYFVHSFALPEGEYTVACTTLEESVFSSMVIKGSVAGFQFHPERSGPEGLALLDWTVSFLREER